MGKKYMDQDIFDLFCAAMALEYLKTNIYPSSQFDTIWMSYESSIIDDNVKEDVMSAVKKSMEKIEEWELKEPVEFLSQFIFYIDNYDREGKKKKKKLFRGTLFMKSVKNPDRVKDFINRVASFYIMVKSRLLSFEQVG